jgi:excisionase family DNA binding protein
VGVAGVLPVPQELVDAIADAVVARLEQRGLAAGRASDEDRWMTTAEAADYLGMPLASLHKLTAGRELPFSQEGPGARCYFKRSALDAWRGA